MAKQQKSPEGKVKARLLVECSYGKPNDVIEIDADVAESLAGQIDTDTAAIAYAESLAAGQAAPQADQPTP